MIHDRFKQPQALSALMRSPSIIWTACAIALRSIRSKDPLAGKIAPTRLDDHALRDIGLTRAQVNFSAYGPRQGRPDTPRALRTFEPRPDAPQPGSAVALARQALVPTMNGKDP